MAVHDTEENGRSEFTRMTLDSLMITVDWNKNRLIVINNNSYGITKELISDRVRYNNSGNLITLPENIGTARAINIGIKQRKPGEHVIKIDNDVVIDREGWVEQLEEAVAREPKIGQIGLKRKDCWETTWHENPGNRSELIMLPHEPGQRWILVERVKHVIGTCVLHSSALLDKVGYLYQPGLYGYDDTLMSARANVAGFMTCFLSHIEIDHIDPGGTEYIDWKHREALAHQAGVHQLMQDYISGAKSIYYDYY